MNTNSLLISVVCGLIAAVLFLSPLSLGTVGMALSSFTAMPLFIAVLGFGTIAGIVACVVSALTVAIFFGPLGALSVLVATLVPALWIGHSAGLARHDDGQEEWFPLSQILFRLAVVSAAVVIVAGYMSGYTSEWAAEQTTEIVKQLAKMQEEANPAAPLLSEEQIAQRATTLSLLIPFVMPASILILMVINLRLAERFVRARKWILRPVDHIPSAAGLPNIAVPIFIGGLGVGFLGGQLGLVGQVIAGAFGGAFVLVGLAVVHFLTQGVKGRAFIVPLTYVALLLSTFIAPVFAALGVAETLFQLRSRFASGPTNNSNSNTPDKEN